MSESPVSPEPASSFQCDASSSSTPKPSSKRRRLTVVTPSSLKRPFKSPLRPLQDNASSPLTPSLSSTLTPSLTSSYTPSSQLITPLRHYSANTHTLSHIKRSTFKATPASDTHDPELKQLNERRRELEIKVTVLRENIRSLKTFKAWRETGEEQKVVELIEKWKRVVQDTATFLLPYLQASASSAANSALIEEWQNWSWGDAGTSTSGRAMQGSDVENNELPQKKETFDGFNLTMEVMLKGVGIDPLLVGWNEEADAFE